WIPQVAAAAAEIARGSPDQSQLAEMPPWLDLRSPGFWTWFERIRFFVLELGSMSIAFAALAAPRTKAYVDAVANEAEKPRPSEEDEEPGEARRRRWRRPPAPSASSRRISPTRSPPARSSSGLPAS